LPETVLAGEDVMTPRQESFASKVYHVIKEEGFYGRSCTKARYIVSACLKGFASSAESGSCVSKACGKGKTKRASPEAGWQASDGTA
jgi:hypothetical protein